MTDPFPTHAFTPLEQVFRVTTYVVPRKRMWVRMLKGRRDNTWDNPAWEEVIAIRLDAVGESRTSVGYVTATGFQYPASPHALDSGIRDVPPLDWAAMDERDVGGDPTWVATVQLTTDPES